MLVLVNPQAGAGNGLHRWRRVIPLLDRRLATAERCVAPDAARAAQAIRDALAAGEREFVAAGGDGTVNLVVSTLLAHTAPPDRGHLRVGAIGLGSSNDFHKPHRPESALAGVPARLDFDRVVPHDVGRMRYWTTGGWHCRHWILNASIGITAEGNRRYNDDPRVARAKHIHPDLGMAWAALGALRDGHPRPMDVGSDGARPARMSVTNIGVVKNPHFTGMLRYDTPYEPGSGLFDVHLLGDVGALARARAFAALCRGRFTGLPGTASWRARRLRVTADRPFAVEGDGEVITTTDVTFSLDPQALAVCS